MSLEDKQEKIADEFIYCAGIQGNLKRGHCEKCDHFGGIRKEPIKRREGNEEKVIGLNEYILCRYPKLEKIHKIYDLEG
jgi:hypothetical protein